MRDYGATVADYRHERLKSKMRLIYGQAQKDVEAKLARYTTRFNQKATEMAAKLANGEIDRARYQAWVNGQVFIGNQWRKKLDQITGTLADANQQALNIIHGEQMDVFAENYNYQQYQLDRDAGAILSFDIYDKYTVQELLEYEPELLPRRIVDGKKDAAWNRETISNVIAQGIIQGESIPDIAKRMARETSSKNMKSMVRYARTAMTCAQNSGRMEMLRQAQGKGIKVKKVWTATLDKRTRDAHQHLDGQVQNVDDPFESTLGEIMFPGDPDADPANVYNCRCTLTYDYPDFSDVSDDVMRRDNETGEEIEDMTYDEWVEKKDEELLEREGIISERMYERELQRYDDEIEELRQKRQRMFDSESYDKAVTDELLDKIFKLEDEKVDFVTAYRLSDQDSELCSKIMSGDRQKIAEALNSMLDKNNDRYGLRDSVWNGKTFADSDETRAGVAMWNGEIGIHKNHTKDFKTYVHELIHMRSINADENGKTLYKVPHIRKTEEGSVEFLTQKIMKDKGVSFNGTYRDYVTAIQTIKDVTNKSKTDLEFAKELYGVDPSDRFAWLEKKAKRFKAANNNSEDIAKLDEALDVLR